MELELDFELESIVKQTNYKNEIIGSTLTFTAIDNS